MRLIRHGEDGVESEERQVTVMFTDIAGFTTASQQLTPHDTADFLNHHFGLIAAAIDETGGTLDKYMGDAVMAFWGAPDDQPDHDERACRAALSNANAPADAKPIGRAKCQEREWRVMYNLVVSVSFK